MPWKQSRLSSSDWLVVRWMLIIRPVLVTSTLGLALFMMPSNLIDKNPITAVLIGTFILTLLYWMAHYVTGVSRLLLATEIAFDIFIITFIVHFTGSYESFFIGFYYLSIMCASLFFRRIITFLFSLQAAIFFSVEVIIGIADMKRVLHGSLPEGMREIIVLSAFLYIALMFVIGMVSSYYAEKLQGKDTALINALKLLHKAKLDTTDILQSMTNGLIAIDMESRIIYINSVAESILELDSRFITGKLCATVFDSRASGLVDILNNQRKQSQDTPEQEITITSRKGQSIPLGLTSMPLYDIDGSRRGVIVNFKDLTEKKQLLDMLRQSERMAAIGQLSAAIAHEIRNPLASLYSAVEMLAENLSSDNPQVSRLMHIVEKESNRLQKISTDFLHFARMDNPEIVQTDLTKAIDDTILLIENDPRKKDGITITNNVPPSTLILFDQDQLNQLLLNTLINSLEAIEGDKGEISFSKTTPGENNTFIRLIIGDSGPGFAKENITSIFEPFYSTKKEGTGLGLALVRKITVANKGRVSARNRKNGGAEIVLDLIQA